MSDRHVLPPFEPLFEKVRRYNPASDEALLRDAYVFGREAHSGDRRQSGEPYFTHPIAVAEILIDWRVDDATIATAFLHDTVEDVAHVSLNVLRERFGDEVAELVDGVTKLEALEQTRDEAAAYLRPDRGSAQDKRRAQAENLRKMLIAMSRDPRVLLVKLADRLHNARTFGGMPMDKQRRKAQETMDIYAPLAGRMGMQFVREDLEDICFKILHPSARGQILRDFVRLRRKHGEVIISEVADQIAALVAAAGIKARVSGRKKKPFSIWRKMNENRISFDKMSDVVGFRVIVGTPGECYAAMGALHQRWAVAPSRFKDYISVPKNNGYQSLHTTVYGDTGHRIEVQIRTESMDLVAERGVAAHWSYREGGAPLGAAERSLKLYEWLREVVARFGEGGADALEFLESAKAEMHLDQIYCLTPAGEVIHLPREATPLDFAYAVHTELGDRCYAATVDDRPTPLSAPLSNGQTVRILQTEGNRPTMDLLSLVKTTRARAGIKRAIRARELREHAEQGRKIVDSLFRSAGARLNDTAAAAAAASLRFDSPTQMFAHVWRANLEASPNERKGPGPMDILRAVDPRAAASLEGDAQTMAEVTDPHVEPSPTFPVSELRAGSTWRYCRGCLPVPGDRIIGIRAPAQQRVTIHRPECPEVAVDEANADQWIYARWEAGEEMRAHLARFEVELANQPSALGRMCLRVGELNANIDDLTFTARRPDYYRLELLATVRDLKHLYALQRALNEETAVLSAVRAAPRDDEPMVEPVEM